MQPGFADALLAPDLPVPGGLIRPDGTPAPKRFAVYRNNVVTSLIEALEAGFPITQKLVGDEFFKAMAGIFVRQHPPISPVMTQYGAALPEFLATFAPAASLPYLPDVARLEVLTRQSLHAADGQPSPDALSQLPQEALGSAELFFLPSTRLMTSDYPVLSIAERTLGLSTAPLPQTGEDLLLTRPQMTVTSHVMPNGGALFVQMLMNGTALGAAAEAMPEGFDLSTTLTALLASQAITSATLP
ncbi:MAG: putative DNA-binding domain-containing protein [Pseudomonadota bacterium]